MRTRTYKVDRLAWQDEPLEELALPSDTLRITRGLGSGLARHAGDPLGTFWAVGDRGPNLKAEPAVSRYGLGGLRPLMEVDGAKIMPFLAHGPAISRLRVAGERVELISSIPLRGGSGRAISGLPVPGSVHAELEPIFSIEGTPMGTDPSGVDSEGIAVTAEGGFWIGDEYGPSLLRVAPDGAIRMRWVPAGTEPLFEGADYPVAGVLPAIAAARRLNRGFEAVALSPDEAWLYIVFQSPLAHPDRKAHETSRNLRVWQLDASSGAMKAEYLYRLEPPSAFRRDLALGDFAQSDVKVGEAIALDDTALLVLERGSASTRIYRVELRPDQALPAAFRDAGTRPTLEQLSGEELEAAGIRPLAKTLLLDTDETPEICGDLEGMILLSPCELLLVNDNDFGIEGARTEFWRLTFDAKLV